LSRNRNIVVTLRARIAVLLATLMAFAPVGAYGHARYFCRMMARVVDDCCCASDARASAPSAEARVQRPDCCDKISRGVLPSADARRDFGVPPSSLAVLAAEPAGIFPAGVTDLEGTAREGRRALPARGPPLFIRHCALLI
jgi:hypothetical protein